MRETTRVLLLGSVLALLASCSPEMAQPPDQPAAQPPGAPAAAQQAAAPAVPLTAAAAQPAAAAPAAPAAAAAAAVLPRNAPPEWTSLTAGEGLTTATLPLTDVLARAEQLEGQVVRTDGTVDMACPGGCWLLIGQGLAGGPIRVKLEKSELKVPPDSRGAVIDVQGVLDLEKVPLERAQHLEDDRAAQAGEPPKVITVEPTEVVLRATGWSMNRSPEQAAAMAKLPPPPCGGHHEKAAQADAQPAGTGAP